MHRFFVMEMADGKGLKDPLVIIGLLAIGFVIISLLYYSFVPSPALSGGNLTDKKVLGQELGAQENLSMSSLMSITENESVTIVLIRTAKSGETWRFPLSEFPGQFTSLGMYSDSFIRLNQSQIQSLNESETIWLTPMLKNGSGLLFNAIYSNEVNECNPKTISILGRVYPVSKLKNGSLFESDDKWKVALDYQNGCLERIVVYQDGYFYNLKDGEMINLFRNDDSMMFGFVNLSSGPMIKVIAAKTHNESSKVSDKNDSSEPITPDANISAKKWNSIILDGPTGGNYSETAAMNESGIFLEFEPAIPVCTADDCYWTNYLNEKEFRIDEATDNHRVFFDMPNGKWMVARMRNNGNDEKLELAKEREGKFLQQCSNDTIRAGNRTWSMLDFEARGNDVMLILNSTEEGQLLYIKKGEYVKVDDEYLYARVLAPGYTFCSSWAEVSVYSETISLTDQSSNTTLVWENESSGNPSLKSIFIPKNSQAYARLVSPITLEYNISSSIETQVSNQNGLRITFDPGIPMFSEEDEWCSNDGYCFGNLRENTGQHIFLMGNEFDIAKLRAPNSSYSCSVVEFMS